MIWSRANQTVTVGTTRPNQLTHTYGVGSVADMPNISVITLGLDYWDTQPGTKGTVIEERRLLAAVRSRLGDTVNELRLPPYAPDEPARWSGGGQKVGVPVGLFPTWLRCTDERCSQLGRAGQGLFELDRNVWTPEKVRYVHTTCQYTKNVPPTAVPARFVLACPDGHLDEFPWMYFVHKGRDVAAELGDRHTLKLIETGVTGEPAAVVLRCTCGDERRMSLAFGSQAAKYLPTCRGRHPHLDTWSSCTHQSRTMVLGATNMWFPVLLRSITVPRRDNPLSNLVAEFWPHLNTLAVLGRDKALELLPKMFFWAEFERYPVDEVWRQVERHVPDPADEPADASADDLLAPEWQALTDRMTYQLPDFTTEREDVPEPARGYLREVRLVPRLREVAALFGFTRVDAPPWDLRAGTSDHGLAPLSDRKPSWLPCAQSRGEGVFLRLDADRLGAWENEDAVRAREAELREGHLAWCHDRSLDPSGWPGIRYILLHSVSHALIRQFALESGYGAAGIRERIYARDGMAGILLYTAAPDSEGTLGGLVSLGRKERLGPLIDQALDAARLCSSDPLCAEHSPVDQKRLYGAACHACLFAAETSCERGNHYLDRALLVDTLAGLRCGLFTG